MRIILYSSMHFKSNGRYACTALVKCRQALNKVQEDVGQTIVALSMCHAEGGRLARGIAIGNVR